MAEAPLERIFVNGTVVSATKMTTWATMETNALRRLDGIGRRPGQRDVHATVEHRGRHHEDHEQHQHHVHQRDHVDLGHEPTAASLDHGRLASSRMPRVSSALVRSIAKRSIWNANRRTRARK